MVGMIGVSVKITGPGRYKRQSVGVEMHGNKEQKSDKKRREVRVSDEGQV